jgi:hypothetical protein
MAIAIKSIPILCEDNAKKFVKTADKAYAMKASIDFSEQVESANKILEKAKMK